MSVTQAGPVEYASFLAYHKVPREPRDDVLAQMGFWLNPQGRVALDRCVRAIRRIRMRVLLSFVFASVGFASLVVWATAQLPSGVKFGAVVNFLLGAGLLILAFGYYAAAIREFVAYRPNLRSLDEWLRLARRPRPTVTPD